MLTNAVRKASKETPMDTLRRLVQAMDYEHESILDDLPSIEAVIDYRKLWDTYNTELMSGIEYVIRAGASPEPLQAFIDKYNLPWSTAWVKAVR